MLTGALPGVATLELVLLAQAATSTQLSASASPRQALAITALVIGFRQLQARLLEQVFQQ